MCICLPLAQRNPTSTLWGFALPPPPPSAGDAESEAAERKLMEQMGSVIGTGPMVTGSNVGKFIGLEGDTIRKVTSEYKQREDDMKAAAESGQYLAVRRFLDALLHSCTLCPLFRSPPPPTIAFPVPHPCSQLHFLAPPPSFFAHLSVC